MKKSAVLKELHTVLKAHGISAKIGELSFKSSAGAACTCPGGGIGVLAVVNGKVVCVCD